MPRIREPTESLQSYNVDFTFRRDLHHVILELRRVAVITSNAESKQDSIDRGQTDHQIALSTRMDEQHRDLRDRLDALETLAVNGSPHEVPRDDRSSTPSAIERDPQTLRVLTSHRTPCRSWCPCACHTQQELNLRAPAVIESVIGKMFVGYSGLPVLNKPCDFRVCRDRQKATAAVEYWFPWWFLSMNLKLHFTYLPRTGPQLQLSTTRRIPDDSQAISFAMQGNIDGLKTLFSHGLAGPRDVSDSRGFTLMRVSMLWTTVKSAWLIHQ